MSTYSDEHKLFLKNIKKNKWLVRICQLAIISFFLIIWEIGARIGWINTFLASSPSMVIYIFIKTK